MVKNEDEGVHDANKYYYILKMALDIKNSKLMIQILSYIQVRDNVVECILHKPINIDNTHM